MFIIQHLVFDTESHRSSIVCATYISQALECVCKAKGRVSLTPLGILVDKDSYQQKTVSMLIFLSPV